MIFVPYACQYGQHARTYGRHDVHAPARVMVRETCPKCDHFVIKEWCSLCWQGVQNSGKRWVCDKCDHRIPAEDKLKYIQRIGDV